ncbi:MAG: beta-lactamase family protein [Planctomycetaceae bacterium]|nr:beta-lactamase family protein [Planctomycetaceae bacterium]
MQRWVAEGEFPALAVQLQSRNLVTEPICTGSASLTDATPVNGDTRFLVASLTKPVVAMGVLLLVEQGRIGLNDRVVDWLPEFSAANRKTMTVRHLLSHTSGLPDMLPDNRELRRQRSKLDAFVRGTCTVDLEFPVGRGARYQSMGYALLGPIVAAASGMPLSEWLRTRIFQPLGMAATSLGEPAASNGKSRMGKRAPAPIAEIAVPEEQQGGDDWNWNSPYWRALGAPWGGMISTVTDLSRFCRAMVNGGLGPNGRVFSLASVKLATQNRLHDFPDITDAERRTRGWGLGWRMNWLDHHTVFCDLLPETACGHWGATGTLFWLDCERELAAVLLSTQPLGRGGSKLTQLSNAMVAALC